MCFGFRKKLTPKSQVALVAFSIELKAQQAGAFFRVLFFFQRTFRLYCLFHQRKGQKQNTCGKRLQEFVLSHDPANIDFQMSSIDNFLQVPPGPPVPTIKVNDVNGTRSKSVAGLGAPDMREKL